MTCPFRAYVNNPRGRPEFVACLLKLRPLHFSTVLAPKNSAKYLCAEITDEHELRTVVKVVEAAIWYTTAEEVDVDIYLKSN